MSKQAYHALTMYASARKARGSATASAPVDTAFTYEGTLRSSNKIDIAPKSGDDEQSMLILNYAWGEVSHPIGTNGDGYSGSQYMSHMTDVILQFEEGVKFKDNIHMLDAEGSQWMPNGHMVRIPLIPTGDRWQVADSLHGGVGSGEGGRMHSPFHTSLDMVLPLENFNSGGIGYKLFYSDVDTDGKHAVVTGDHLASFGLHMQVTGPDIQR